MTKRNPVSSEQNIWYDAEQVDAADLTLEQDYNQTIQSAIISNHLGTGIISESLQPKILFDSEQFVGFLDGTKVEPQIQPSDNNYGNQLEIILTNSKAAGKRNIKVCLLGLDFENNLQYETFIFKTNENQFTQKHYISVLLILVNDFYGPSTDSMNLGGRLVIKEADPYSLSRNPIVSSQNSLPNLFFRDFYVSSDYNNSLSELLSTSLPFYDVNSFNTLFQINQAGNVNTLYSGDVVTKYGQKFLATSDNIQKIKLLLSITQSSTTTDWLGELVVTVYALQTSVQYSSEIPPNELIGYPPNPNVLAQISFSQSTLAENGIVLDKIPQPIDFVFSNSRISKPGTIVPGQYYMVTVNRSGATGNPAANGNIGVISGNIAVDDSIMSIFALNSNTWTDQVTQNLWFEVYADSAKVSDGQAYQSGNGVQLNKTTVDSNTGATIDYCFKGLNFSGNDNYTATLFGNTSKTAPQQDLRTGNMVYSRQSISPEVKLLNSLQVNQLQETTDTLLLGNIRDKNIKFYNPNLTTSSFTFPINTFSIFKNQLFIEVITNGDDPRYSSAAPNTQTLESQLISGGLVNSRIYPDNTQLNDGYRIASAELIQSLYGDLNGDGIIDDKDLDLLRSYVGFDFNIAPPHTSSITLDSLSSPTKLLSYQNGYQTYVNDFEESLAYNVQFAMVDSNNNIVNINSQSILNDGYVSASENLGEAYFKSQSYNLGSLTSTAGNKLIILSNSPESNHGVFEIIAVDAAAQAFIIRKIVINEITMMQLFRGNIDGYVNRQITAADVQLLEDYISKKYFAANEPYNNIGKSFNVIKLTLEKFTDRNDDYFDGAGNRSDSVHQVSDIDVYTSIIPSSGFNFYISNTLQSKVSGVVKQLTWEDYLIVSETKNKLLPVVFNVNSATPPPECNIVNTFNTVYQEKPEFNPGAVDYFVPNNLIIGNHGELLRSNGEFYKNDFEIGTIILEIPTNMTGQEKDIDLINDFIAEYTSGNTNGLTAKGFPAMRFADCSTVKKDAIQRNQLRFSVSLQSFSPNTNGANNAIIVDGKIGVYIDPMTGVLRLNFTNLFQDPIYQTLNTKVQVQVFIKKAGWNNQPLYVDSDKVHNLLNSI